MFTSAFDYLGIEYTLPLALGAMTALYALRTVLVVTQEVFVARQIAGLMVQIKSRMVDQLLRADYQYFTKRGVGYFNNAATVEFTKSHQRIRLLHPRVGGCRAHGHVRCTGIGGQSSAGHRLHGLCSACVLPTEDRISTGPAGFGREHGRTTPFSSPT